MDQKIVPLASKKRLSRFFSLIAAALVSIVLVGSVALILNVMGHTPPETRLGSQGRLSAPQSLYSERNMQARE